MTSMQISGNDVLNAIQEGTIATLITLYNRKQLATRFYDECVTKREIITALALENGINTNASAYWLDWFKVET